VKIVQRRSIGACRTVEKLRGKIRVEE